MHTLKAVASSTLSLPADNYIYSIVPSAPGTFAAISSDDSLRVFEAADLDRGSVVSPATHKGVTALQSFGLGESHLLATGGRDGKVKVWDVRAGNGSPVVEMETGEFVLVKLFYYYYYYFLYGLMCLLPVWVVFGNLLDMCILCLAAFPVAGYWVSGNLSALGFNDALGLGLFFSFQGC
jgi:hypothetical protein